MRHQILSDESLDVMREIWARGEASVNTVWAALNASRRKKVRRTTVQVQMTRLERYGWLGRKRSGREFIYTPLWGKDETVGDLLSSLARRLYGGSFVELARILLTGGDFPPAEMRRIRTLLRQKKTGVRGPIDIKVSRT
jgi:BlaI family penicillinase repressor